MKKYLFVLLFVSMSILAACSETTETTRDELSENAQNFNPHSGSYEQFVQFYNEVQDALNEELELGEIYEAFDELEEEKREIQSGLVDVTQEELTEAASELEDIADARAETLYDESAVFDEIESQLDGAAETLDTVVTRGYSTRAEPLLDVARERLDAQRAILDGKYDILSAERELYVLFADEDATQEDIDSQSAAISEIYVEVGELSSDLGEHTEELNEVLENIFEYMN